MDNKVLTIFDVANYFRSKEEMTHKKLQKLVYYAYAWYIALYNENKDEIKNKLCDDAMIHLKHGFMGLFVKNFMIYLF